MSQFENVTVVKKANVYFDGKVTSRTVYLRTAQKKHSALCCQASMSLEQMQRNYGNPGW